MVAKFVPTCSLKHSGLEAKVAKSLATARIIRFLKLNMENFASKMIREYI